ncbi:hypothetical protein QMK19_17690 [Streptomyces sp. H10-C2]|uniref:DoxX family protein n=1 Tax=unclassified Streptomyces TaxID=2593676 RepID=UPI0024BBA0B7|nr:MULTISPECIES: hypothetical protein [unclassified Streptomyces]MDJ0342972.1 hypothetical protein [Streptomyces sp. PH10-H1]MDJ0371467.1 hypothetical protein [Streptomyces sp. H10-C2]
MAAPERSARLLVGLLAGGAAAHFLLPKPFDATIPRALPGRPRTWTYASGVVELAVATAVAVPATRRVGGLLAAGLFTAIFPANVKMAYDWRDRPAPLKAAAYARLPLQAPLVLWALRVSRQEALRRQG